MPLTRAQRAAIETGAALELREVHHRDLSEAMRLVLENRREDILHDLLTDEPETDAASRDRNFSRIGLLKAFYSTSEGNILHIAAKNSAHGVDLVTPILARMSEEKVSDRFPNLAKKLLGTKDTTGKIPLDSAAATAGITLLAFSAIQVATPPSLSPATQGGSASALISEASLSRE